MVDFKPLEIVWGTQEVFNDSSTILPASEIDPESCGRVDYEDERVVKAFLAACSNPAGIIQSIDDFQNDPCRQAEDYRCTASGIQARFNKLLMAYHKLEADTCCDKKLSELRRQLSFLIKITGFASGEACFSALTVLREEIVFLLRTVGSLIKRESAQPLMRKTYLPLHGKFSIWNSCLTALAIIREKQPIETTPYLEKLTWIHAKSLVDLFVLSDYKIECQCFLSMVYNLRKYYLPKLLEPPPEPLQSTLSFADCFAPVEALDIFIFAAEVERWHFKGHALLNPGAEFLETTSKSLIDLAVRAWPKDSYTVAIALIKLVDQGCLKLEAIPRAQTLMKAVLESILGSDIRDFSCPRDPESIASSKQPLLSANEHYLKLFALLISNENLAKSIHAILTSKFSDKDFTDPNDQKFERTCVLCRVWLRYLKDPLPLVEKLDKWIRDAVTVGLPGAQPQTQQYRYEHEKQAVFYPGAAQFSIVGFTSQIPVTQVDKCAVSQERLVTIRAFVARMKRTLQAAEQRGPAKQTIAVLAEYLLTLVDTNNRGGVIEEMAEMIVENPVSETSKSSVERLTENEFGQFCSYLAASCTQKLPQYIWDRAEKVAKRLKTAEEERTARLAQSYLLAQVEINISSGTYLGKDSETTKLLRYLLDTRFICDSVFSYKVILHLRDKLERASSKDVARKVDDVSCRVDTLVAVWIRCVFSHFKEAEKVPGFREASDAIRDFVRNTSEPGSSSEAQFDDLSRQILEIPAALGKCCESPERLGEFRLELWVRAVWKCIQQSAQRGSTIAALFVARILENCGASLTRQLETTTTTISQNLLCLMMLCLRVYFQSNVKVYEPGDVPLNELDVLQSYITIFRHLTVDSKHKAIYLARFKELFNYRKLSLAHQLTIDSELQKQEYRQWMETTMEAATQRNETNILTALSSINTGAI
ncbi:unnamed protein product, partial [Mesorhabditis spiculigera]